MAYTREDVIAAVRASFSAGNEQTILGILDLYGTEPYERERDRVQVTLLSLSQGSEAKLLDLIQAAKTDYRDILSWAQTGSLSELEGKQLRHSACQLIERWGKR